MKQLLRNFPVTLFIIIVICYLSFFTPPKTDMEEIPYIDKIVHLCMYGGLTGVIWFEYIWHYRKTKWKSLYIGGILFPVCMSGIIEILQGTCTTDRSGDWCDFIANCVGIGLACILSRYLVMPLIRKKQSDK